MRPAVGKVSVDDTWPGSGIFFGTSADTTVELLLGVGIGAAVAPGTGVEVAVGKGVGTGAGPDGIGVAVGRAAAVPTITPTDRSPSMTTVASSPTLLSTAVQATVDPGTEINKITMVPCW